MDLNRRGFLAAAAVSALSAPALANLYPVPEIHVLPEPEAEGTTTISYFAYQFNDRRTDIDTDYVDHSCMNVSLYGTREALEQVAWVSCYGGCMTRECDIVCLKGDPEDGDLFAQEPADCMMTFRLMGSFSFKWHDDLIQAYDSQMNLIPMDLICKVGFKEPQAC